MRCHVTTGAKYQSAHQSMDGATRSSDALIPALRHPEQLLHRETY